MAKSLSTPRTTIRPSGDGFAVAVGGEIIRAGLVSRGHAAMWAARQKIYKRKTPPRRPVELPPDLEDLQVILSPQAAKIVGVSYGKFLEQSKAGLWGPRIQTGAISTGHTLGDLKRGVAARTIK